MRPERPSTKEREPIVGWRSWDLSDGAAGPLLHPVGGSTEVWRPRAALIARCSLGPFGGRLRRRHEAPDPTCGCGIYAVGSIDAFERRRPAWPPPPVIGTVSLWGRVVAHERGWRAERAYPARLRLVCPMCAWFEPGPGRPVVVHGFLDRLYPLCERHRGGIELFDTRRSAPTRVDPDALQARLLDAYAVDQLPFDAVAPLLRRPRTPDPPGYVPTIRVVERL
jgi:hypothetical protein